MRLLAVETSAGAASCAICENGTLVAQYYQDCGQTHSRTIMPMIEAVTKNCDISPDSFDCFAVAVGPGSFTGLRIGVSAVKGLCWSLGKPACGVSTLHAMAKGVAFMLEAAPDAVICPVMDARRNQVYNALFGAENGNLAVIRPDRAISVSDLAAEIKLSGKKHILVGDGAEVCYDTLIESGLPVALCPQPLRKQTAWGVALAALNKISRGETVSGGALELNYLRLPQAERERLGVSDL